MSKKQEVKTIRIRSTYSWYPTTGEVYYGHSMVVPDESYTIEEILDKFTKGIPLGIQRDGQYSDTDDFDDVDERTYLNDLTDIADIESSMAARRSRAKAKAVKQQQKATELAEKPPADDSKP